MNRNRPALGRPPGAKRHVSGPWRAASDFDSGKIIHADPAVRGNDHPVIVFAGLGARAIALAPLSEHSHGLGYAAFDWAQSYSTVAGRKFDDRLAVLAGHTSDLLARFEQGATLIGRSLGGLYARELAKLMNARVRQVITIGTPFNPAADRASARRLTSLLDGATANINPDLIPRLRTPPPVPTTSIYSRSDSVVDWRTCRHDEESHWVQDVEIEGSQLGMGCNPAVLGVVTDRLAQRTGGWDGGVLAVGTRNLSEPRRLEVRSAQSASRCSATPKANPAETGFARINAEATPACVD